MTERSAAFIQHESLATVNAVDINLQRAGLIVEAAQELDNEVMLLTEPEEGAPSLTRKGNRIIIEQTGRYRSDAPAVLRVPDANLPGMAIRVARGDVAVEGVRSSMAVQVSSGQLDVSGGDGELVIDVGSGNVAIRDRQGDIVLKCASGDVAMMRCEGSHVVNIAKGDVAIVDCATALNLKLARGDVAITRPLDSAIKVSIDRGSVAIDGGSVRNLNIDLARGDISSATRLLYTPESASETEGLTDDEFDLDDIQDAVRGEGHGVTIEFGDVPGEEMRFNLGNIQFMAGEGGVRLTKDGTDLFRAGPEGVEVRRSDGSEFRAGPEGVEVRRGDGSEIFVTGESGIRRGPRRRRPEQYRLATNRGSIQIDIPDDQAARVELIVNSGSANSDIPLVEVGRPGPRSTTRRYVGVSDSSDPERVLIRARTNRGDINVRTTPMGGHAAEPPPRVGRPDKAARRRSILEALARGDLSPAEAETLIAAIDRDGG